MLCFYSKNGETISMHIGQKIKALRKEHGLTQIQLAKKIGIDQPHLARWESGGSFPSLFLLKKVTMLFDVSLDLLVLDSRDFQTLKMKDRSLLSKLKNMEIMTERDKETVIKLIESLSKKVPHHNGTH